jgi:hypothetical protein
MYSLVGNGLKLLSPQDSNVTLETDNFLRKASNACAKGLGALAQTRDLNIT